jgi:hypothetical protein
MHQILELASWAPSGDNEQPWTFRILDDNRVEIHFSDTRDHCVYDLRGRASQIAFGAFFETLAIAATGFQLDMRAARKPGSPDDKPVFDVVFTSNPALVPDPLIAQIPIRSVQRRPMSRRTLTTAEKTALEQAVGAGFTIQWLEGSQRTAAAKLMFNNAKLRLLMPEAYRTHKRIIIWPEKDEHGVDKPVQWGVPAGALGIDPMTMRLMKWAMHSWDRLKMTNAILGTAAPRLQMDLLPGLSCAAHFVIRAPRKPESMDDFIAAGRAMQRCWLTLTQLGLVMQPEMTPLIFDSYLRDKVTFTAEQKLRDLAESLALQLKSLIGPDTDTAVFMGRMGAGAAHSSRSERRPLEKLLIK